MADIANSANSKQGGNSSEDLLPPYLQQLNEEQRRAVLYADSNLLVHAGAGSGKTRVVIARILHHILAQGIPPYCILAVTFTNRAAREMRERLAQSLGEQQSQRVLVRTFHSFGAWLLRRCAAAAGLARNFSIYDEDDAVALLKQTCPNLKKEARRLQYQIAKAKDAGLGYGDRLPDKEELQEFSRNSDFAEAFLRYTEALRRSGNADFADLLGLPVRILEQEAELRSAMQRRFRRILVDEYQDSNPMQNRLLRLLLGPQIDTKPDQLPDPQGQQQGQQLCIVGDEDQSIYAFRGADIQHILGFSQTFAPAHILRLEQNYRSRRPILQLANQVIARNQERLAKGKNLRTVKQGGKPPEFHYFDNCEEEAVFVAQRIRSQPELRSAILYRTNAQSRTFERIFREYNIPYRLIGNLSFYRREEIKDVVAYLKCLANAQDQVSFERIANKPRRGLGPRTLQSVQDAFAELTESAKEEGQASVDISNAIAQVLHKGELAGASRKALERFQELWQGLQALLRPGDAFSDDSASSAESIPAQLEAEEPPVQEDEASKVALSELIQEVLERSGLLLYYRQRDEEESSERCLHFDSLLEEAQHFGCGPAALAAFLESVELETQEFEQQEAQRLAERQTLITMHNTKGLEFERVFVTGLELGIFPQFSALSEPRSMEEERRLFYVAITRAEEELYLSAAQFRNLYGQTQYRDISPLLNEIDPEFYRDCRQPDPKSAKQSKQAEAGFKKLPGNLAAGLPAELQKQTPSQPVADPYVVGARVEHLELGLGYVVQRKRSAAITTLMIRLDDGRLIRLQLEFQGHKLEYLDSHQTEV